MGGKYSGNRRTISVTKVISLFGGEGCGKSTVAYGLMYFMKIKHISVEYVREYVKSWAWDGRKVNEYDQYYINGKQAKYESSLYGRVDVIVTDSPILLSPIYEHFYGNDDPVTLPGSLKFIEQAEKKNVKYLNFLLKRDSSLPYSKEGRYNSLETAKQFDDFLEAALIKWNIPFIEVNCKSIDRVDFILDKIANET